jgi:hypothetical protein
VFFQVHDRWTHVAPFAKNELKSSASVDGMKGGNISSFRSEEMHAAPEKRFAMMSKCAQLTELLPLTQHNTCE